MTGPQLPNLFKVPELKEKLLFTFLCLLIYRIGAHIATPGVNVQAMADYMRNAGQGTLFSLYDLFAGGGFGRATVFALGIMPYISASIVFQLAGPVFPIIEKMQRDEEGRKKLTQWTRYLTVVLCLFQAYGYALFTETQIPGAVATPGLAFRLTTVLTLTTGGIFIMWLGEQITERGIGNGASLLIFFSIVERIWPETLRTIEALQTTGSDLTISKLLVVLAVMVLVVAGTVAVTVAARRIPIQIPRKVMGRGRIREGQKTFIPLRINSSGVMPIIFAQSIIIVPGTLAQFSNVQWLKDFSSYFNYTSPAYLFTMAVLIVFFAYFYTSIIFNPVDLAENLKKQGGFIPGVKPGAATADYIDAVLSRITLPGALFLTVVAILPIVVSNMLNMPFGFGGTALLIVVGVALDTVQQVQQHLLLRNYDGFMKEGRVKFRGRQQ
ncbi:MAG: preprotein translocase subunit SecY [Gemmatimonadetes bacterium 13_1_40CM_4_69_8]|nr:MAG: preprotein translocase subunit SecY [Gemmatimonadetes bacterium 13_1_40CM_70_15]OLC79254.1 MAG: preprotein translocase subunit SecY [Gemmatimonadetes bacterium 13_1_40CM_4_69_8]PYP73431.1 MAG: preprotein translocase subunit SecY [Gemmatimonadota bacterium]